VTSLRVRQIQARLRTLFEGHLDLTDIGAADKERDVKILSRCLAAFAIYQYTACSPKDAAEAVWDGSDDNGLDAVYFDASSSQVVFVQSKWISKGVGEPDSKDVGSFVKGVSDVIESEHAGFHSRLQARLGDISMRLITPGTSLHLIVVSTGASTLSAPAASRLTKIISDLNNPGSDPIASFGVLGLSEVYTGLADDPSQSSFSLDATILDWSYVSTPYPAYFGIIDGQTLKGWWKKYGRGLVAQNIRHSLGVTDVNKEIVGTASATPENFWYFNNGITLIADDAVKAPLGSASRSAGAFSFKGASIVNGAQTVSSLSRVDNDAALSNVRVSIRVVLLKTTPAGFGQQVTRTNNLQNRVEARDFVAHDPEQRRIRQEMVMEGVDYQFVRSDDSGSVTATSCELLEVTTALACASGDPNLAVQVKTGIGRFFIDLTKAPYKTIFNPTVSGALAFNVTVTHRQIEAWIDKKKKNSPKRSGPNWGVLIHGNRILAAAVFNSIGSENFAKPIAEFPTWLATQNIEASAEKCYGKMVNVLVNEFPGKWLAVLFKNPSMSKRVFDVAIS
jgi:hypothetical protein